MSEMIGRIGGLDTSAGLLSLPLWTAGAAAALLVVVCVLALSHAGREGAVGAVARVTLLLIGAGATLIAVEVLQPGIGIGVERHALDARAQDLVTRAVAPGSALACLDAVAGDTVEAACEKAVFQTPEATAAAVSYVTAQLALLADFSAHTRRPGGRAPMALATLRRAIETDRFGLVAQALAIRDGCTPADCAAFALLEDSSRVAANLAEHTYDLYVARHAAAWPASGKEPVAAAVTPTPGEGAAPVAPAQRSGVFFPSAASIPPVSIMDSEPAVAPETTGSTAPPAGRPVPPPPRRPAQSGGAAQGSGQAQSARPPIDLNAASRTGSPAAAPQ